MNDDTIQVKGFAHQAARGSWICPLLLVVLIIVGGRTGQRLIIEFIAFGMMCVGVLLAIVAFFGIPKYGVKRILGQAIAGLVLNGLFLFIFVTNFLAARAKAGL